MKRFTLKKLFFWITLLVVAWITIDLIYPFKTDISNIDAAETAKMDGDMWKAYYEKKPVKLFFQSAKLMRSEFYFPLWRSFRVAYYAAKAAFVFKDGRSRADYEKALPSLKKYYGLINNISKTRFNTDIAAASELEWWIIRREREKHPPEEWETWLALTPSVMYHLPPGSFSQYACLRVQAMLLRDEKGDSITADDWQKINQILLESWRSFSDSLKNSK